MKCYDALTAAQTLLEGPGAPDEIRCTRDIQAEFQPIV